jgi:hypothetical protein
MDGSVGEKAKAIPGLWGSTMAFSGGSHSCIGYKFTIYECVAPHLLLSPLFLTRAQGEADPARAELHVRRRARGPARGHRQDRRHHVAPVRDEPEGGGRADARHLAPRRGGRVSGDLGIFMAATRCGCGASYFISLLLDWARRRTGEVTRPRQPRSTARSSSQCADFRTWWRWERSLSHSSAPTRRKNTGSCPPSARRLFTNGREVMPTVAPTSSGGTASVTLNAQMSACRISFALYLR